MSAPSFDQHSNTLLTSGWRLDTFVHLTPKDEFVDVGLMMGVYFQG